MKYQKFLAVTLIISSIIFSACNPFSNPQISEEVVIKSEDNTNLYNHIIGLNLGAKQTIAIQYFNDEKDQFLKIIQNDKVTDSSSFKEISNVTIDSNGDVYYLGTNEESVISLIKNDKEVIRGSFNGLYLSPKDQVFIKFHANNSESLLDVEGNQIFKAKIIDNISFGPSGDLAFTYKSEEGDWYARYSNQSVGPYSFVSSISYSKDNDIAYITKSLVNQIILHINEKEISLKDDFTEFTNLAFETNKKVIFAGYAPAKMWYIQKNDRRMFEKNEVYNVLGEGKNIYLTGRNVKEDSKDFIYSMKKGKDIFEDLDLQYTYVTNSNDLLHAKKRAGTWLMYFNDRFVPNQESTKGYIQISKYYEDTNGNVYFLGEHGSGDIVLASIKD
ncbi:hypothetical protein COU74_04930 [Candidatus Peregrinibacteria bacterium CG10_big_fil_rev_8_21_14_0_10_36_19]|nr:MAG: hypothetical protein COU74_04930 [Candidatus Peregrinibacteria bacterium CG10_big_fil_rev_8_21_14_0_10_36_19]